MKTAWPWAAVAALALLSGCGGTAVVPVAIYSLDGLSYASSGKGIVDHTISAAEHKDCSFLHAAQTGELCKVGPALQQAPAIAMVGGDPDKVATNARVRNLLADAERAAHPDAAAAAAKPDADVPQAAMSSGTSVPFN